jgi:hypothetical protein
MSSTNNYNIEFLCTYIFYDSSLVDLNPISKNYFEQKKLQQHNDVVGENVIIDDSDDEDGITDSNEKAAGYLYNNELLYAFNMEQYDNEIINNKIHDIYELLFVGDKYSKINNIARLKIIIIDLADKYCNGDLESGFIILFSYNYFHITHLILCNIFRDNMIDDINIQYLVGGRDRGS